MERKKTKYSGGMIVALCSLVYFVSYFSRKDFAAVLAGMLEGEVITNDIGGLIGTALFICYGAGQLVSGYLGDKMKPELLMIAGLITTTVCNLMMPLVPSPGLMIPVWAVNGFAQAMLWPPIVRILSDNLDHERFVRANLIISSVAHVATILLYLYVPVCLEFYDWQTVFFTATAICSVSLVLFVLAMWRVLFAKGETKNISRTPQMQTADVRLSENFLTLFRKTGLFLVFFAIVMMGFLRDGIESWLPTLYCEAFERPASESILLTSALPVFSIVSLVLITALHKRPLFNNEARGSLVLFAVSIVFAVPLALLINSDIAVVRILCLVLATLVTSCMHATNFLLISCVPGRFSKIGRAATASGFCNACTYIGAAISMYGIAALSERYGWMVTVISWIVIAAFGAVFSFLSLRRYSAFIKKEQP